MRPKVFFVGRVAPRSSGAERWRTMPVHEFAAGRSRVHSPAVVVLGDGALDVLAPRAAADAVHGGRTVLVVAPMHAEAETIALWARSYVGDVVSERRLADRVRLLEASHLRVRMQPADWLPAARGNAEAEHLLGVLMSLGALRVGCWAAAAGHAVWDLRARCRRHFGCAPKEVVRQYVAAQNEALAKQGLGVAARAEALGYSDGPTLLSVLREMRRRAGAASTARQEARGSTGKHGEARGSTGKHGEARGSTGKHGAPRPSAWGDSERCRVDAAATLTAPAAR